MSPLPAGTKRYQHNETKEIRYFRNPPNLTHWSKIGTPGSKAWKWVNNGSVERFISPTDVIPEGYIAGRIKT